MEYWSIGVLEQALEGSQTSPRGLDSGVLRRARFFAAPLVTPPLSIKLLETMGSYKGRTNVRHRKRRAAKAERMKTVPAKKETDKKST